VEDRNIYERTLLRLMRPRSAIDKTLRRVLIGLLLVNGVAGLLLALASLIVPKLVNDKDIVQEYVLPKALLNGADPALPVSELASRYAGIETLLHHPTPHPPTVGIIFLPLSALDYRTAVYSWFAISLISLLVAVWMVNRSVGFRPSFTTIAIIALISIGWSPVMLDLNWGQLMIQILVLLVGAYLALSSSRQVLAGALLGASLLLKPTAWPVFLVFIIYKKWRAMLATVVVVLVGYALACALWGFDSVIAYFTRVLPEVESLYQSEPANASLSTLGWRLFSGTDSQFSLGIFAPPLWHSEPLADLVSKLVVVATLALSAAALLRLRDVSSSFGLMIVVAVLISPVSWDHYHVLTILPVAQVISSLASNGFPRGRTASAFAAGVLLLIPYGAWILLALAAGGIPPVSQGEYPVSLLASLITMGPALALIGLGATLILCRRETGSAKVRLLSCDALPEPTALGQQAHR